MATRTARRRGSILIAGILVLMIMAVALASFLRLAQNEMRLADRAFFANAALNLAEAGVELALNALNHGDLSGWEDEADAWFLRDHRVDMGRNVEGVIHVVIENPRTRPRVTVEGSFDRVSGGATFRQVEVRLVRRSMFANGLTARDRVRFSGGVASVDSYHSGEGPPSATNRNDRGFVASASVEVDSISLSNAHVWGYVATGRAYPNVGPNGTIRGEDSPSGNIDPARVALDFWAEFPPVTVETPLVSLGNINSTIDLGVPGETGLRRYHVNSVHLANNQLRILSPVELVVVGDINVGGNSGEIVVEDGASLVIYAEGDVTVGGQGIANLTNRPENLLIFGTATGHQDIELHGRGSVQAAVYAPNATLDLKGGGGTGMMAGAAIANNIFINGTYSFHFDEALLDWGDDGLPYRVDRWREILSAADRYRF